jgi:capsule polysaccharide export protein KpsE/RkpR
VKAASSKIAKASEKARKDATSMARSTVEGVKKRVKTAAKKYGYM